MCFFLLVFKMAALVYSEKLKNGKMINLLFNGGNEKFNPENFPAERFLLIWYPRDPTYDQKKTPRDPTASNGFFLVAGFQNGRPCI